MNVKRSKSDEEIIFIYVAKITDHVSIVRTLETFFQSLPKRIM